MGYDALMLGTINDMYWELQDSELVIRRFITSMMIKLSVGINLYEGDDNQNRRFRKHTQFSQIYLHDNVTGIYRHKKQ
jgi:hypothetical protein